MPNFAYNPATHRNPNHGTVHTAKQDLLWRVLDISYPGGVSASNVRVPMEQLMFSAEQQTAVINAWGGQRTTKSLPVGSRWTSV